MGLRGGTANDSSDCGNALFYGRSETGWTKQVSSYFRVSLQCISCRRICPFVGILASDKYIISLSTPSIAC